MNSLFRAPAARGIKKLDTSLFSKVLPTTAAAVRDNKLLSKYRKHLEKSDELLRLRTISPIVEDPSPTAAKGQKCLLLAAELKRSGRDQPSDPNDIPANTASQHPRRGVLSFKKPSRLVT